MSEKRCMLGGEAGRGAVEGDRSDGGVLGIADSRGRECECVFGWVARRDREGGRIEVGRLEGG